MARLLLGVSGSIAAYKSLELIRLATAAGHGVRVLVTDGGERFVGRESFTALTGAPVLGGIFETDPWGGAYPGEPAGDVHRPIGHLALAERADLLVIAPASANVIARLAAGIADDLLTAAALVADRVLIAPAMNNRMWEHPATQQNLLTLQSRGVVIAPPGTGRLASRGEEGTGRVAEPADLLELIEAELTRGAQPAASDEPAQHELEAGKVRDLSGVHVVVTAGGTREPIDAVRFLGNRSSGRMGIAVADAARERGARVTLIAANVSLQAPEGVTRVDVETAEELQSALAVQFGPGDVLVMAAAVADFRPVERIEGKAKKLVGEDRRSLELSRTPDILASLADNRAPGQVLVGFAAEYGSEALAHGRAKLEHKGVDAIVVNDVSDAGIGFESEDNEVVIVTASGDRPVERGPKRLVADAILDVVAPLIGSR